MVALANPLLGFKTSKSQSILQGLEFQFHYRSSPNFSPQYPALERVWNCQRRLWQGPHSLGQPGEEEVLSFRWSSWPCLDNARFSRWRGVIKQTEEWKLCGLAADSAGPRWKFRDGSNSRHLGKGTLRWKFLGRRRPRISHGPTPRYASIEFNARASFALQKFV